MLARDRTILCVFSQAQLADGMGRCITSEYQGQLLSGAIKLLLMEQACFLSLESVLHMLWKLSPIFARLWKLSPIFVFPCTNLHPGMSHHGCMAYQFRPVYEKLCSMCKINLNTSSIYLLKSIID